MQRKAIILIIIMTCYCVFFLGGCTTSMTEKAYYKSLSVEDPDLSRICDGQYSGEHTLSPPFGVIVAQNHVDVEVIINNQTLQIDALSGTTSLTGKAYLKAIEDALE